MSWRTDFYTAQANIARSQAEAHMRLAIKCSQEYAETGRDGFKTIADECFRQAGDWYEEAGVLRYKGRKMWFNRG